MIPDIFYFFSTNIWSNASFITDLVQYATTALGISSAVVIILLCFRYRSHSGCPTTSVHEQRIVTSSNTDLEQKDPTMKRTQAKVKRRNILNLKAHELRNFENESELENFYCWRQSLSPAIEDLAIADANEYGEDSEMTVQLPHPEQERYKDQLGSQEELMNPTEIQKSEYDPIVFDKFYRNHVFLPKFVKCHIPIEKYTETKLATLEADKESLNIKYTADDLSYGKLMKLLDQELVPIDISPEMVTEIVVNNGQLSNDEILETLSAIFDLCIKNKIAEWSFHFRKSVQPYFRNRHYRKLFQTREINDLLNDIQNYYSPNLHYVETNS